MKTLQEIQDEYVKDNFPECKSWEGFTQSYATFNQDWFDIHWKHICVRAQQEQQKLIAENAKIRIVILGQENTAVSTLSTYINSSGADIKIDKVSILNENNIIR